MNTDDCILHLSIIYEDKPFNISSENIITIKEIKEKAIEYFNLKEKDKDNIKLFLKNGEQNLFISSENDIIQNTDDSDINNPKLNLNLLIEAKEQQSIQKNESIPSEKLISNECISEKEIIKNINRENKEIKDTNMIKYNELKNIIEKLSNEIKLMKEEQFNKFQKLEQQNLNMKNEIQEYTIKNININRNNQIEENKRLELMIKTENNKIKEEYKKEFKNLEELNKKNEHEINEFKESVGKKIEDIKNNNHTQEEIYNDIFNNLNKILDSKMNKFGQKFLDIIKNEFKDSNLKIQNSTERIECIEKEVNNLKDFNLNKKNEIEEYIKQININIHQQNEEKEKLKNFFNIEHRKMIEENEKNIGEIDRKIQNKMNEFKDSQEKIIKEIKKNNEIENKIDRNLLQKINNNLDIQYYLKNFEKELNNINNLKLEAIKKNQDEKMENFCKIIMNKIIKDLINRVTNCEKEIREKQNYNLFSTQVKKSNRNIIIEDDNDNNNNNDEFFFINNILNNNSKNINNVNKDNNVSQNKSDFCLIGESQDNILNNIPNINLDDKNSKTSKKRDNKYIMELKNKFPDLNNIADEQIQFALENSEDEKDAITKLMLSNTLCNINNK